MSNSRLKKWLAALATIVGIALLCGGLAVWRLRAPYYQGKSLQEWSLRAYLGDQQAAAELRTLGKKAVPGLIRLLQARDSTVYKALWSPKAPLPDWVHREIDKLWGPPISAQTRSAAARSLGIIGPDAEPAIPYLARALRDPSHQVVADTAGGLAGIGVAALPVLLAAAQEPATNRARTMIYAIAQIGPAAQPAIPELKEFLQNPDPEVRAAAGYALDAIRSPLLPALYTMSRDHDAAHRREAIQRLDALQLDTDATNLFVRALKDPDESVRAAARHALGR